MMGRRRTAAPARTTTSLCIALLLAATSTTASAAFWGSKLDEISAAAAEENPPSSTDNNYHQVNTLPQTGQGVNSLGQPTYGVDVSFPIHHVEISDNYAWLPHNVDPANNPTPPEHVGKPVQYLGNVRGEYDRMIRACEDHYGGAQGSFSVCKQTEADRVEMSIRQPASMQNYTELGFKKIRAPKEVWDRVKKFWEENKARENWKSENWPRGNTYTNHVSMYHLLCARGRFVIQNCLVRRRHLTVLISPNTPPPLLILPSLFFDLISPQSGKPPPTW